MIYGLAALAAAVILMKKGLYDKLTLVILILAGGVVAKSFNIAADLGGDIVKGVTFLCLLWIVGDLLTKRIEKVTYPIAFIVPFFGVACSGKLGDIFQAILGLDLINKVFSSL